MIGVSHINDRQETEQLTKELTEHRQCRSALGLLSAPQSAYCESYSGSFTSTPKALMTRTRRSNFLSILFSRASSLCCEGSRCADCHNTTRLYMCTARKCNEHHYNDICSQKCPSSLLTVTTALDTGCAYLQSRRISFTRTWWSIWLLEEA